MSNEQNPSEPSTAPAPSETLSGRIVVGFLVAGMFLVGLVVLVALATFAYSQGLPMVVISVLAIALLAGVFALLRRWANA